MKENTILIIAGPTASGKTELGIKCANLFNGEIISADSMQIYKNLDIGTAKPNDKELKQAKHHMVDIIEADKEFSVQEYVKEADKIINKLFLEKKLPIIVGGTGLYIKSLIYPYSFCNANKNSDIRSKYNKILEEKGKEYLFSILEEKDPDSCKKIHMNDTKRVIRAIEICEITGQEKTRLNNIDAISFLKPKYNCIFIVLDIPRDELYNRINIRVNKMFDLGLEKEIKNLLENGLINKSSQSMQAIGYKEFFKYFDGEINLSELKELICKNSRNYAKRQLTFFRGMQGTKWFNPLIELEKIFDYIQKELI